MWGFCSQYGQGAEFGVWAVPRAQKAGAEAVSGDSDVECEVSPAPFSPKLPAQCRLTALGQNGLEDEKGAVWGGAVL